jgi:hypothetical protein
VAVSASWASASLSSSWADFARSASWAISASWAPGGDGGGTTLFTGSTYQITASSALSSSYTPLGRSLVLCSAYTPPISGADSAELIAPFDVDGTTPISWSVKRLDFRAQSSGSLVSGVEIEKSVTNTLFSSQLIGPVTLSANTYEGVTTGSLGSVNSGDKIRFNVITLGNSQNWTIITEISR